MRNGERGRRPMHEMSVALEICRIAEAQVGHDMLAHVREVGLEVGRQSGIEPDHLVFCLEALFERAPFAGARASLELTPGEELSVIYLEVDDVGQAH